MINDEYPTCADTHATLGVFSNDLDPESISRRLGLEPSEARTKPQSQTRFAWLLRSEGHESSKDVRRHLEWLLERIEPVAGELQALLADGCTAQFVCLWVSAHGHGGPTLSPGQLRRLAVLGLDVWFDFYDASPDHE